MTDIENRSQTLPGCRTGDSLEDPAYAITVAQRQVILAHGVDEDDAWKQAAVGTALGGSAAGQRVPRETASQLLKART